MAIAVLDAQVIAYRALDLLPANRVPPILLFTMDYVYPLVLMELLLLLQPLLNAFHAQQIAKDALDLPIFARAVHPVKSSIIEYVLLSVLPDLLLQEDLAFLVMDVRHALELLKYVLLVLED